MRSSWEFPYADLIVPTLSDRYAHIISAIDHIEECLQGLSQQQLARDQLLPLAFERLLEIISVATDHIPTDIKNADVTVDWKNLAELGERLENPCERIEVDVLWDVTQHKLGPLKAFAKRHMAA
jgi:uncharacterized protein with HEPN domain